MDHRDTRTDGGDWLIWQIGGFIAFLILVGLLLAGSLYITPRLPRLELPTFVPTHTPRPPVDYVQLLKTGAETGYISNHRIAYSRLEEMGCIFREDKYNTAECGDVQVVVEVGRYRVDFYELSTCWASEERIQRDGRVERMAELGSVVTDVDYDALRTVLTSVLVPGRTSGESVQTADTFALAMYTAADRCLSLGLHSRRFSGPDW